MSRWLLRLSWKRVDLQAETEAGFFEPREIEDHCPRIAHVRSAVAQPAVDRLFDTCRGGEVWFTQRQAEALQIVECERYFALDPRAAGDRTRCRHTDLGAGAVPFGADTTGEKAQFLCAPIR